MKNIMIIPILLFATSLFSSCEDEDVDAPPVEFEFRLLDENGNPSTEFDEAENFVFSFLIINKSLDAIYVDIESFFNREFFRVYKVGESETNQPIDLGTPYGGICNFPNGFYIGFKDTLKIELPWRPNNQSFFCQLKTDNTYLTNGSYKTGFSSSFIISKGDQSFTTPAQSFNINFNIK